MASDRWVAILGAGREQIPAIRAIKRAGYKTLGFDSDVKAPGRGELNRFSPTSNRDVQAMEAYISRSDLYVVGYLAAGSEVAIEAARLSGVGLKTALLCRDKKRQKEALALAGVPHTPIVPLKHPLPLVVKPRFGSGSRGVTLVRRRSKILAARDQALAVPTPHRDQEVLYEIYQPGPQLSTETLVWDGKAKMVAMVDRFYNLTVTAPKFVEYGGSCPSHHIDRYGEVERLTRRAAIALDMKRGVLKCDVVLTTDGPAIIECTPRVSGGPLTEIVRRSTGVDYLPEAVRICCGEEPIWANLVPTKSEQVSVDMKGNSIPWADTRAFIKPRPGSVTFSLGTSGLRSTT